MEVLSGQRAGGGPQVSAPPWKELMCSLGPCLSGSRLGPPAPSLCCEASPMRSFSEPSRGFKPLFCVRYCLRRVIKGVECGPRCPWHCSPCSLSQPQGPAAGFPTFCLPSLPSSVEQLLAEHRRLVSLWKEGAGVELSNITSK